MDYRTQLATLASEQKTLLEKFKGKALTVDMFVDILNCGFELGTVQQQWEDSICQPLVMN